jgi:hypothetical protein
MANQYPPLSRLLTLDSPFQLISSVSWFLNNVTNPCHVTLSSSTHLRKHIERGKAFRPCVFIRTYLTARMFIRFLFGPTTNPNDLSSLETQQILSFRPICVGLDSSSPWMVGCSQRGFLPPRTAKVKMSVSDNRNHSSLQINLNDRLARLFWWGWDCSFFCSLVSSYTLWQSDPGQRHGNLKHKCYRSNLRRLVDSTFVGGPECKLHSRTDPDGLGLRSISPTEPLITTHFLDMPCLSNVSPYPYHWLVFPVGLLNELELATREGATTITSTYERQGCFSFWKWKKVFLFV